MDEKNWLLQHLPESITTLIAGFIAWLARRAIAKVDAQEDRIAALERSTVTKDDFDELRESMNATFTNGIERVERRTDEILLHLAGKERL